MIPLGAAESIRSCRWALFEGRSHSEDEGMANTRSTRKAEPGYKGRSTAPVGDGTASEPVPDRPRSEEPPAASVRRRKVRAEPSRYAKRSAHLPHLGDEVDHDILDEMEILRADSPQTRRR